MGRKECLPPGGPLAVYALCLVALEAWSFWATSPSSPSFLGVGVYASPILSKVENRTKQYFYSSYPPGNPLVRISRSIRVREDAGKKISYASITMYNTTLEDTLLVPEERLANLGLEQTFYPQQGMAQLIITGNRSANVYQQALRNVNFQAPNSYLKTADVTRFWRNVTFQVVNVKGVMSNTLMRPVRLDAAWKVLTESFPGLLDDQGKENMFM